MLRRIAEEVRWRGRVRVTTRYLDGRVEVEEFDNLVTNAGKNLMRNALSITGFDPEIKYVALGDGVTVPDATQTQLVAEKFRKAVTQQTAGGTGVLTTTVYIAPDEANATSFTIQEIGWFAGVGAIGVANSGVMVARVLYTRAKTNLESIQIDRTDTIS